MRLDFVMGHSIILLKGEKTLTSLIVIVKYTLYNNKKKDELNLISTFVDPEHDVCKH